MRRILMLLGFSFVLLGGTIEREFTYSSFDLSFTKQNGYDVVRMKNAGYIFREGAPKVPVMNHTFCIPPDAKVTGIEVLSVEKEFLGNYRIYPVQPPRPFIRDYTPEWIEPDPEMYSLPVYPDYIAKVIHSGKKHGFKLVTVSLAPLEYHPATGELFLRRRIKIRLLFEEGKEKVMKIFPHEISLAKKMVRQLVVNPEDVDRFSPRVRKDLPDTIIEYVILVDTSDVGPSSDNHPEILKAMKPLAYWKTKRGIPTRIVTLDWIEANFDGATVQDKIRNFLAYADTAWGVMYALFVGEDDGDSDDSYYAESDVGTWFPRKDVCIATTGLGYYQDEDTIAADFWFSDWNGDRYMDVYVGRVLFDEAGEAYTACSLFVERTLRYEKNPPSGYQPKILLTSECLFDCGTSSEYDGAFVSDSIAKYDPSIFYDAKCYDETGNYSSAATIESLNTGYGFHHGAAHGNETGYMYGSGDPIQVSTIENDLNTNGKLYIFYAISCFPGAYDYDSYAEHLMTLSNDGAVACMLNYRYGFGTLDYPGRSEWQNIWFTKAWSQEGYYRIGDARDRMNDQCVPYTTWDTWALWCMLEYNLYGDPALEMWTDVPDSLVVIHDDTVLGPMNFTVTVYEKDGTTPVESAYVCLWCKLDEGMYVRGYTDASGKVTLYIAPSISNDTMWVTVTKHNYLPYEGYALVDLGCPSVPTIISLFDKAKVSSLTPTLEFVSTDPEGDEIEYMVYWDDDPSFSSPDSAITGTFNSGEVATFTFSSPLVQGETYYWKVKGRDPYGSGYWGLFSSVRSFTVDTLLPSGTCSWYLTDAEQWQACSFINAVIDGDSIVLPPYSGVLHDTIFFENFESGVLPSGWSVVDGDADGYTWYIATTGQDDLWGNEPPNAGSYYAYYSDDDAGSTNGTAEEYLISPSVYVGSPESLYLLYGWGFCRYESEILYTQVRFHDGSMWGSWSTVASHDADGSGVDVINLTSYLPAESVQVQWLYDDQGGWGWAAAVDNVLIEGRSAVVNTLGVVVTPPVSFAELAYVDGRSTWGKVVWHKAQPDDSIGVQVEYLSSGAWSPVPDADLPGNSSGFFTSERGGWFSIDSLDPSVYDTIRLRISLYRTSLTKASTHPALISVEVGNLSEVPSGIGMDFRAYATSSGVMLRWNPCTEYGVEEYRVYRSEGGGKELIFSLVPAREGEYSYLDRRVKEGRVYQYWLCVRKAGAIEWYGPETVVAGKVLRFGMELKGGNVLTGSCVIQYTIPQASRVKLGVYDVSGRKVLTLVDREAKPGIYRRTLDVSSLSSGIYFIYLEAGADKACEKVIIAR